MRVLEAVATATALLADAHLGSPRVDAELLAAFVLGVSRGQLLTAQFTVEQQDRYTGLVRQRASRVPLQYLTGSAPFRQLDLKVGEGVFVPRPETESVVGWGLDWLRGPDRPDHPLVVDLCAGSGAIALSVATEHPGASVIAVERDPAAYRWLRANVSAVSATDGVDGRVRTLAGDATEPTVLSEVDGRVDLVLTNPPYVPEIGAAGLPAEVSEHDPHIAVFAGTDGLDVIRALIPRIAALLRPGGAFALEHDDTHAYVVPTLVHDDGRFADVRLHHDLARRPRFTTATRG